MKWLLPGPELTEEYLERAYLGGLTDGILTATGGRVYFEMDENSSDVQARVSAAFPEAERVEGTLAVYLETAAARGRATICAMVAAEFYRLRDQWLEETQYESTLKTEHEAYQAIIRMGPDVVPLLLEEERDRPNFWSRALIAITGENPIPKEAYGNIRLVSAAWVAWGREKGYLPSV